MSSQPTVNGLNGNHYKEINHHYAEECSQDDIGTFLFTSESVGEGHPGNIFDQVTTRAWLNEWAQMLFSIASLTEREEECVTVQLLIL
jgi:hypothetical protein